MVKSQYLLSFILILSASGVFAQSYTLSGQVKDTKDNGLEDAYVFILHTFDSSVVRTTVTDNQIKALAPGNYMAKVQSLTFTGEYHTFSLQADTHLDFTMYKDLKSLSEVVVKNKKPFIESDLGKTTLNLGVTEIAAGSSALDILRKAPGVLVHPGSAILLNGNNVLVLVDDKPTYLSGKDLEEYLKSLSAEQLGKIELMSQPTARYDKEGSGGIINLRTKKKGKQGWNGVYSSSVQFATEVHPALRSNLNLNYNAGKLHFFTNAAYVHVQAFLDQEQYRVISDPSSGAVLIRQKQSGFYKETWEDYSLQLGFDYKWNARLSTGASLTGVYHPNKEFDRLRLDTDNSSGDRNMADAERTFRLYKNGFTANSYAKFAISDKQKLTVDFDFIFRDHRTDMGFRSTGYDARQMPNGDDLQLKAYSPFLTTLYSAKADYEAVLPGDMQLEAGLKSSQVSLDNDNHFQVFSHTMWQNDSARSNHFVYGERIQTVYADIRKKINTIWTAQLGLRLEDTRAEGLQITGAQGFARSFTTLFPTAYIGCKLNERHSLELNYGKRIARPNYVLLNPFIQYTAPHQYNTGNPYLLPSYSHVLQFKHNYRNRIFSSVELTQHYHVINPVIIRNGNTLATTSENNASKQVLHASCYTSHELFKWWNISASADVYYQAYKLLYRENIYAQSLGYSFDVQNGFSLPRSYTIEAAYFWSGGDLQSMTERNKSNQWLNIGVSKKLMKDTATVKIALADPFNAYRYIAVNEWNGVETYSTNRYLTQQLSLSFTYNIGKQKELADDRHRQAVDESKRM